MESRIKEVLKETEKCLGGQVKGKRTWWDVERTKRGVRKELRNWRKEGGEGDSYKDKKRAYKKLCEKKKKEDNDRW